MNIIDRIKRSIANRDDGVFLRGEFERFGGPAQVGRSLAQLTREGALIRIGVGGGMDSSTAAGLGSSATGRSPP